MMALSGVRNSWLMVARKRLFAALARSASACASSSACWCCLRVGHVAQHRDDLAAVLTARHRRPPARTAGSASRSRRIPASARPSASTLSRRTRNSTELGFRQGRGIAERGQIGRAVGDMDALEQAVAMQFAMRDAEQRFGGRRYEQHGAIAAVPRDDVGDIARQQPVTVLLGIEQPEAGSRQRLGAEREPGRVKRRPKRCRARQAPPARLRSAAATDVARRAAPEGPAAPSANVEAVATTRRDAESAASSGTTTSQIAAKEAMPPVDAATAVTSPVSASDDSTCALS